MSKVPIWRSSSGSSALQFFTGLEWKSKALAVLAATEEKPGDRGISVAVAGPGSHVRTLLAFAA